VATSSGGHRLPPPLALALLVAAGVVALQALLVPLFAGPATSLAPRDLPVVVAGPPPATAEFAAQLNQAQPGSFAVTQLPDAAAADAALRDRTAYAAFVLEAGGVGLHVASAASPPLAALLNQAATDFGGQLVAVTDVVPSHSGDPRGAGFASAFLPLVMTSLIAGALVVALVPGWRPRLLALAAYAVLAGLVGALVQTYWLDILPAAGYLPAAAAIALMALAAAGGVAGLGAALGGPGIGLGAVLVFLVGNPLSGVNAVPELLPQPWGQVGQWLPPGAGTTALRSAVYFDWAGSTAALLVLIGWAVVGALLVMVGRARLAGTPSSGAAAAAPAAGGDTAAVSGADPAAPAADGTALAAGGTDTEGAVRRAASGGGAG